MADRPILFSAPMVRALLEGRKTQTRRVAKFVEADGDCWHIHNRGGGMFGADDDAVRVNGPDYAPFAPGDRLWVKETWAKVGDAEDDIHACPDLRIHAYYRADRVCPEQLRWRPSIFMPRWASRLTLLVTDVRVERLQDISEADAIAEGVYQVRPPNKDGWRYFGTHESDEGRPTAAKAYANLWNSINGPGAWAANPWVVAVTFQVRKGNIDG